MRMALEAWEMAMRQRGFDAVANQAKELREEYGDIPTKDQQATLTFPLTFRGFGRGQVTRDLKYAAWANGIEINIEEDKGFLSSVLKVSLNGPYRLINAYYKGVEQWAHSLDW